MTNQSAFKSFTEIINKCVPLSDTKSVGIAFLYLEYYKKYGVDDKELKKTAEEICNQYIAPVKDKITKKDILKYISDLKLEKSDYYEIGIKIASANNRLDSFVSSEYHLSELVCMLLNIKPEDSVFDLGSGYGTFLAMAAKSSENNSTQPMICGQEINLRLCDVSKMLLTLCDARYKIENINSIENSSCPTYTKGYVFPPFGLRFGQFVSNKFNNKGEAMFNTRTSSEWMFVFRALESLAKNGKLIALLPEGTLFKTADSSVRKYLIDNGLLETIISLPSNALASTGIKTDLLIFSYGNKSFKVVNGETIINKRPEKGLTSHEVAVALANGIKSKDSTLYSKKDISSLDYSLTISALASKDLYQGINNLVDLTSVVDILRGSPLTVSSFNEIKSSQATPYRILTSSNIENGIIDYESLSYINDGDKYEKFSLKKNDIVLTSKSTKVKVAVVNEEPDGLIIVIGGMIILRPKTDDIDSTFLKLFFDSNRGKSILSSVQKGIVITTISYENLTRIKVPCPSLDQQRTLSKKYNSLLAIYDGMRKELNEMEGQLDSFYDDSAEVK